jgi:flagellin
MRLAIGFLSILISLATPIMGNANFGWEQVNISRFGDSNNSEIEELIVFGDFLYAVVENEVTGVEVWRYEEGKSWSQVNRDGFGDRNNYESEDTIEFNGKLYVETNNEVTGSEIWRYEGGISWTRVDPGAPGPGNGGFGNAYNVETNLQEFQGILYATAQTWEAGLAVVFVIWRYNGGTSWEQINVGGFGDDGNFGGDTIVFDNKLYVATKNYSTGIEVWRYENGKTWTQVNTDGFGNYNNRKCESKIVNDNFLYIRTSSWEKGEIWRYNGGTNWTNMTPPWDTESEANDMIFFNGDLYVLQDNESTGCDVWKYDGTN